MGLVQRLSSLFLADSCTHGRYSQLILRSWGLGAEGGRRRSSSTQRKRERERERYRRASLCSRTRMASSSGVGPVSIPDPDEVTTAEIFIIASAIVAGLFCLVVLRFLVVLLIDLLILGDVESAKRSVIQLLQYSCCCFYRFCPPESSAHDAEQSQQEVDDDHPERMPPRHFVSPRTRSASACSAEIEMPPVDLSLLKQILPSRIVTEDDLQELMAAQQTAHTSGTNNDDYDDKNNNSKEGEDDSATCSICLHQLHVGDSLYQSPQCRHWFHAGCIRQWMARRSNTDATTTAADTAATSSSSNSNYNNHCPICRHQLVDPVVLERLVIEASTP